MALKRSQVPAPSVREEAVEVKALGGEVIVRGLLLRDRLELVTAEGLPKFSQIALMLERSVVDDDRQRFWSAEEWEVWGGEHIEDVNLLYGVAQRLSRLESAPGK